MRSSRTLTLLLALFALFAFGAVALAGQTVYGKGVAKGKTIKVSALLANPEKYVGQTVAVEGIAVGVCAHRGCWINLSSDTEGEVVRVKVEDGVIVFPAEIVGERVIAEGVWTANKLDMDTTKKMCANQAEQKGESFDPDSVTECMTLYQISGTGAEVIPAKASMKRNPAKASLKQDSRRG